MAMEWVFAVGVGALIVGALLGALVPMLGKGGRGRVRELEAQLAQKDTEMSEYRAEVVSQFSSTAEKFKTLDDSYHALHRQLATSAVALCGDAATPLLTADTGVEQIVADAGARPEVQGDADSDSDSDTETSNAVAAEGAHAGSDTAEDAIPTLTTEDEAVLAEPEIIVAEEGLAAHATEDTETVADEVTDEDTAAAAKREAQTDGEQATQMKREGGQSQTS